MAARGLDTAEAERLLANMLQLLDQMEKKQRDDIARQPSAMAAIDRRKWRATRRRPPNSWMPGPSPGMTARHGEPPAMPCPAAPAAKSNVSQALGLASTDFGDAIPAYAAERSR